jgi:hypothetical protein
LVIESAMTRLSQSPNYSLAATKIHTFSVESANSLRICGWAINENGQPKTNTAPSNAAVTRVIGRSLFLSDS